MFETENCFITTHPPHKKMLHVHEYSGTSMAQTPLGPLKDVQDRGSSS